MRWRPVLTALGAALAAAAISTESHAQVNAEALRSALRKNPNFLWLDGAIVSRAGNSYGGSLSAGAFGGVTRPPHLFFDKLTSEYGTANSELIVAKSLLHLRYNYFTTPFLYLEVLAQVQHDTFRRIAVRDLYGTGLRFNWIREKELELFSGTTIVLEQQAISASGPYPSSSNLWARSSNYAGVNIGFEGVGNLTTVTYLQPRLDRPKDYRLLHETVLTLGITKRLAAKISVNLTYDHEPVPGVLPADLEVKNSLAVKF